MAERRRMECKHRSCYELTRNVSGYCDAHVGEFEIREKERIKSFNSRYNKDNKYNRFYGTQKWRRLREFVLCRDNYLCQDCLKNTKVTEAKEVHHIEKIRKAWDKRYDTDNCISLCHDCHVKRDRGK